MTKLLEWLSVFVVLSSVYLVIVTRQIQSKLLDEWMFEIAVLPIFAVALFGVSEIEPMRVRLIYEQFCFNANGNVCLFSFAGVLSDNRAVSCVYVQRLSRSRRGDPKTNQGSQSRFATERIEDMNIMNSYFVN